MISFAGPGTPLSQAAITGAAAHLGAAPEAIWAVLEVETTGCGFLPDRRPKILFERHVFHRLTNGRFDSDDPNVSAAAPGGYGAGGANQYVRLQAAMLLDEEAALCSASWGLGQIMGGNFARAGYASTDAMIAAFVASEDNQIAGMMNFVAATGLTSSLANRDWATFARLYNGPNYAKNNYDQRLASEYQWCVTHGAPSIEVRAAQIYLNYLGFLSGGVDGVAGPQTQQALAAFQRKQGIAPANGGLTPATLAALEQA